MTKGYARILGSIAAFGIGLGLSVEAQAITYLGTFSGNDCTGGFSDCYAYPGGTNNGPIDLGSPVIIKYGSGGGTEISDLFPSIDGSEFDIDLLAGNVLEFLYTPGAGDPEVHYFTVKQGNQFALFYDAVPITSASIALSEYFRQPGFSHVTFFDTGTPAVPEPSTWAMLLVGFFGIGGALRSVKRREKLTVSYA